MAFLKGFEHLMFWWFVSTCFPALRTVFQHSRTTLWKPSNSGCAKGITMNTTCESYWRDGLQASKLPRLRLGQIIQNGLASPQAENDWSFIYIFFRWLFLWLQAIRWNTKLLPFWWFVRSWARQKRKARATWTRGPVGVLAWWEREEFKLLVRMGSPRSLRKST